VGWAHNVAAVGVAVASGVIAAGAQWVLDEYLPGSTQLAARDLLPAVMNKSSPSARRRASGDDDTLVGMAAELVRSDRLFSGVPYAYAATAPETGLIVTAGACPLDEQGRVVAPGDVAAQMRQAIDNLRIALEECGAGLRDVLKTTVYVSSSSRDDLVVAWNEVAAGFGEHDPPSTLLGVTVLGYPDQLVEIEAIAAATAR
jgi:enamine deaminase RidA (YjgF/YER057c/UK114 family)